MAAYAIAAHIPVISDAADRSLVRKLTKQLKRYGHAEFTTNAATYRPAHDLETDVWAPKESSVTHDLI